MLKRHNDLEDNFFVIDKLFVVGSTALKLLLQVNLCQKLLFLHQLTHNMTTDCSLNYHLST